MKIVIFCGGYGTRMWPASRKSFPKQFYPVVHGKSFFQNTIARFKKGFKNEDIFISTESQYVKYVRDQAPEISRDNIILEPERRDLLGSIGLVAAVIEKKSPGEVMFFSWSDHFIANTEKFIKAVKTAGDYTLKTGKPVSVNEKPTFPSIHNGWLKLGKKVGKHNGFSFYEIEKHVEKPNIQTAKQYLRSGEYLIHTGYGAWRSDIMLSYYKEYRPKEYQGLVKIMDAMGTKRYNNVLKNEYHQFEKISVEYGLYEHLPKDIRLTLSVETGWEDAGTWQLFYDAMLDKGEDSVIEGDIKTKLIDASKNLIIGKNKKLIAIIGLKNIVVIDTNDALLVCDIDETQKVKDIFKLLEKENPEYIK